MATYTGLRPIRPQKNSSDAVHPTRGEGVYSYWDIFNSTQLLEDMPIDNHLPGTGYSPHNLQMSYWYRGLGFQQYPLTAPGLGDRIDGMRYRPWEYKGTDGQGVFSGTWGHANRVTDYSQWDRYDDSERITHLKSTSGHGIRLIGDSGVANSFGRFQNWIYKGVEPTLNDPGQSGEPSDYGHYDALEWKGVPSAKALSV